MTIIRRYSAADEGVIFVGRAEIPVDLLDLVSHDASGARRLAPLRCVKLVQEPSRSLLAPGGIVVAVQETRLVQ
jgi:hypothetical protein